jgi:hypothetical protein
MAKARKHVKKLYLETQDPKLLVVTTLLDRFAEIAVENYGVKLSTVYPNAVTANLVSIALEREKVSEKIAKSFFKAQNKRREKDGK